MALVGRITTADGMDIIMGPTTGGITAEVTTAVVTMAVVITAVVITAVADFM